MTQPGSEMPRIVFMGSGPFAKPALTMLSDAYEVVAMVTQPDRETGRGRKTQRGIVAGIADTRSVPVLQPHTFKDEGAVSELAKFSADLFIVASYGRILSQRVLSLPPRGTLNLHPSALPRHRGPSPIASTILAGNEATAVSVMEMVFKLDAGPVIAEREVPVDPKDTTATLTARLADENARLLLECLPGWLEGRLKATPQDESRATYTNLLTKEMGRIVWSKPAELLEREIRAFVPWPVSFSSWSGGVIRMYEADVQGDSTAAVMPGQVLGTEPNGIIVKTGKGNLVLREVQGEGGRRMPAAEFVRGHPAIQQAVLGS